MTSRDRGVFVPAVMGAGLLFSLAMLIIDAAEQVIGRRRRGTAVQFQARELARRTTGEVDVEVGAVDRQRQRNRVLTVAAICLGVAIYVAPGAWFNYVRARGYVAEAAWVLALALALAVSAGLVGVVLGVSALRPHPWTGAARRAVWATERLTGATPRDDGGVHLTWGARWHGMASAVVVGLGVASGLWTLAVAMNARIVQQWDSDLLDAVRGWGGFWSWAEPMGRTEVSVAAVLLTALLAGRRAPRLVASHAVAVAVGVGLNVVVKVVVDRPRPPDATVSTGLASYPSGHVIQAVIVAVFVTAAIAAAMRRWWVTVTVGLVTGGLATLCAVGRVTDAAHWPSDVIGGVLLGAVVATIGLLVAQPRLVESRDATTWLRLPVALVQASRRWARRLVLLEVVAVALLIVTVGVPADPEATLPTERLQQGIQLGLLGLVLIGWLVSWWWVAAGAALLAVAGTAMAWFAALEYRPTVAAVIALAFLVPSFLLWLSWQHGRRARSLTTLAVTTGALVSAVWLGSSTVHDRYFGPTHPASTVAVPAMRDLRWLWTGDLRPDGFRVVAAVGRSTSMVELVVATNPDFRDPTVRRTVVQRADAQVVGATFDGLLPGTTYHLGVRPGGAETIDAVARVRTPVDGAQSFRVAFGSCARTGSNGSVFDAIRAVDPLLYLITGDAHYGDVATEDPQRLLDVWERTLTAPAQQALYRQVPVAYVWDDHDYGGNDSDARSPARAMAQRVYRDIVPHASLPRSDDIGHSFVIGRVRFVLTDTRSHRLAAADGSGTLLGAGQEAWFLGEARSARAAGQLVVWVSPTPWIGAERPDADTWAGFADERRRLADRLVAEGVDDLVMLAGDAHMVAIDDGTHSGYGTGGGGGFPVVHGAALDRRGSVKGGPYSEGAYPGSGQFGVLEVDDDGGDQIRVSLSGRNWRGERLVEWGATFDVGAPTPTSP